MASNLIPLRLLRLLNGRERWQLVFLAAALIVRAFVEIVGVASIAPFMSVTADPGVIETNKWLSLAYNKLGFESSSSFLFALGVAVIVALGVSNTFSAVAIWALLRFSWGMHHRLSMRLFRDYLAKPYSFFVSRNSSGLNKTILTEVQTVVAGVMVHTLNIFARFLVVIALVSLLVFLDPVLAVVIVVVLGGAYGTLYTFIKRKQQYLGRQRVASTEERYRVTGEAFSGIKEVKVLQRERDFAMRLQPPSWTFSRAMAINGAIAQVPRYFFEAIAFGGIVMIVLYQLRSGASVATLLPVLSLYAFAGYRLLPELQQIFAGLAGIRFSQASLDALTDDLSPDPPVLPLAPDPDLHPLGDISFSDVRFQYDGAQKQALAGINLRIALNTTVGLVGPSGSGKTTLVDLLLGLYEPASGAVTIGPTSLTAETLSWWRTQVGYVPQSIFLCDDTIASNIAFGIPEDAVDMQLVIEAARVAQLDSFVQTLPDGYKTIVGEQGVRLSGGQRQRIGIARALYHNPAVLIMDEATSALDGQTEGAVMDAIHALSGQKTIILIAHRLSTVEPCDRIFVLDHGKVSAAGTYTQLSEESDAFRAMAKLEPA